MYPLEKLEIDKGNTLSNRIISLISPIGKGQRALIVSPPKAGKTTMLKEIAISLKENCKSAELMVLLIDERPEEVTDIEDTIGGYVISSTFDQKPEDHIHIAEFALEIAKRKVENGKDVVVLLDSITRLARAYNLTVPSSGKLLSGGFDPNALYRPKKFFGAARNTKEAGSLTIIATALVDTGSRLDDVVYEEFKGTGNMELHLDRNIAEMRIYPAINVKKSSTRKDELLYSAEEKKKIDKLRNKISGLTDVEATKAIISLLKKTKTNEELIDLIAKEVKGASYKVGECCTLYLRGYYCGVIPVDSGMKDIQLPCMGFDYIKNSKGNKILSEQLKEIIERNDFREIIEKNGYGNLNIENVENPTWLIHLILIYYKRLYCNKKNPKCCKLYKEKLVEGKCDKEK